MNSEMSVMSKMALQTKSGIFLQKDTINGQLQMNIVGS